MAYHKLRIFEKLSEKWLEQCDKVIKKHLETLNKQGYWGNLRSERVIIQKAFLLNSTENINPKYAYLISLILEKFGVVGIWRDLMILPTIHPIRTVRIYGPKEDVEMALNMMDYLINGFDKYYIQHVKELRRKRINRYASQKTLFHKVDARKRTNNNIDNKLERIVNYLRIHEVIFPADHENKINSIISVIDHRERIDYKKYRTMKIMTHKAMYARVGFIQLNRLV